MKVHFSMSWEQGGTKKTKLNELFSKKQMKVLTLETLTFNLKHCAVFFKSCSW